MARLSSDTPLTQPGSDGGVFAIAGRMHLLMLLVRKEVQIRYRGSALGWLWSYVKPLTQFVVFYVAIGVFMGMNKNVPAFPVYLLAGLTAVTFFNEAFSNGTRSLIDNAALIKKIYLPRQMFPIASTLVALVNIIPQILVLVVIDLFLGWRPTWLGIGAVVFGLIIIGILATGLGMLFGAINVTFRDAQAFVEIITMVSVWASPVMYQWTMVSDALSGWLLRIYMSNPITATVELFHYGLWAPLNAQAPAAEQSVLFPNLWQHAFVAFGVSLVVLLIGEIVFRKLEGRFAQDL